MLPAKLHSSYFKEVTQHIRILNKNIKVVSISEQSLTTYITLIISISIRDTTYLNKLKLNEIAYCRQKIVSAPFCILSGIQFISKHYSCIQTKTLVFILTNQNKKLTNQIFIRYS